MRTPLIALAAGVLILCPIVRAEPEPAAKQAIDQMADAITKAKHLSFHIEVKGVGGYFDMLPTIKADVLASRPEGNPTGWKMRVTGRSDGAGMDATEILLVTDGVKRTWIDYPAKQVIERTQPDQGPVGQAVSSITVRELFEPQPLSKERASPSMKIEAQEDLDGVKCDVVFVDPGENLTKARYAIATTDKLPRRVEMIVQGSGMNGKRVCTLTKVKVDAEPPAGSFAISTPEGFALNAAPTAPPPVPTPVATPPKMTPVKAERAVGPNVNDLAPDFELSPAGGEAVRLSTLKGSVVVIDFWGTWNLSSKKTTAEVEKLVAAYKGKPVKFFGISVREASEAAPAKFFKDNNLTYTPLVKGDDTAKAYRVKRYPTLFVIGKEGEVVYTAAAYDAETAKDIAAAIDRALSGAATKPAEGAAEGKDPTGSSDSPKRTKGTPASDGGK